MLLTGNKVLLVRICFIPCLPCSLLQFDIVLSHLGPSDEDPTREIEKANFPSKYAIIVKLRLGTK
jgi:hypothetical protein